MPVYEYRCRECSADFEKYLAVSSVAVACPTCQSDRVTRKLSVFGLRADGGQVASSMGGGGGCCGGGCSCH
jgi:putative FmdB family regulatory protein